MRRNGIGALVPRISKEDTSGMKEMDVINLNSTYVERAKGDIPRAGDKAPWRPRRNYILDLWEARFGEVDGGTGGCEGEIVRPER